MKQPENPLATLEIEYRDGKGNVTNRIINVPDFDSISVFWINAYCRTKKEFMSFVPEQILRCVDVKTGEAVPDVMKYFEKLFAAKVSRANKGDD